MAHFCDYVSEYRGRTTKSEVRALKSLGTIVGELNGLTCVVVNQLASSGITYLC